MPNNCETASTISIPPEKSAYCCAEYIKIPKAEILGNEIAEQSVFDEKRSVFVPITTQEIFEEIDAVRNSIAEEIVDQGFLEEANSTAQKTIIQMMYALGFDKVEVISE